MNILSILTGAVQQSGHSDSESLQCEWKAVFPGWPCCLECLASLPCAQVDVSMRMCFYLFPHSETLRSLRNVPEKVWDAIPEAATPTRMAGNPKPGNAVCSCDILYSFPANSYCIHGFYWYCGNIIFHYFILTLKAMKEEGGWSIWN